MSSDAGLHVNPTLKQAAPANGVTEDLYNRVVNPLARARGGTAGMETGKGPPRS